MHLLYVHTEYHSVPRQIESNYSILCVCSQKFERNAIFRQLYRLPDCKALKKKQYNDITVHYFFYRGHHIAVAVTGKNILSTSQRLSKLLLLFPNVEKVFFVGIGGSLNPNLEPGDVCIPEKWAFHTAGYIYNKKSDGTHARRYEQEFPNYKDFYPSSTEIGVDSNDEIIRTQFLTCPNSLFTAVQTILRSTSPGHDFTMWIGGSGVSGTVFVDSDTYRQYLVKTYGASVVDMESFAVALICHDFQKFFCVIRGISDLAGNREHSNSENAIDTYRDMAANNAAITFTDILRSIELSKRNHQKIPLTLIQKLLFPPKNPECTIQNIPHAPKVNACF
jgi:adenosylhomocysteine nucleosidase